MKPTKIGKPVVVREGPLYRVSGCKVSWYYYEHETEAKRAADQAKNAAADLKRFGYDFGYNVPGTIRKMDDDMPPLRSHLSGLYEVCFP